MIWFTLYRLLSDTSEKEYYIVFALLKKISLRF